MQINYNTSTQYNLFRIYWNFQYIMKLNVIIYLNLLIKVQFIHGKLFYCFYCLAHLVVSKRSPAAASLVTRDSE